jgi:predicted metal-dependent hydrolase
VRRTTIFAGRWTRRYVGCEWHAVEEIEHKAVAFDTCVATDGSYGMRVFAMLVTP